MTSIAKSDKREIEKLRLHTYLKDGREITPNNTNWDLREYLYQLENKVNQLVEAHNLALRSTK